MGMNKITSDIMEALSANKPKTQAYDTEAQVVRVEGNTAWVHIPGGVDETPVALTINASEGDTVRVRVAGGTAWIMGNDTAPPTDDKAAMVAIHNSEYAMNVAKEAAITTDDLSQRIANANGLYETQQVTPGGATITYMHNKPNLSDSDVQIMISDVGVLVTSNGTDPNPTWYGLTVDGTLIASILQANGINADWIRTGALVIYDDGGNEIFRADKTNKRFEWTMEYSQLHPLGFLTIFEHTNWWSHAAISVYDSTSPSIAEWATLMQGANGFTTGLVDSWSVVTPTDEYGHTMPSQKIPSMTTYASLSYYELSMYKNGSRILSLGETKTATLSFSGSSTYYGTPSTWNVSVRRSGNVVQLNMNINVNVKDATTGERVIASIGSGYRPSADIFYNLVSQNGNRYILTIRPSGNIAIINVSGAAYTSFMRACVTWVI